MTTRVITPRKRKEEKKKKEKRKNPVSLREEKSTVFYRCMLLRMRQMREKRRKRK